MPSHGIIAPAAALIDSIVPDPQARAAAHAELARLSGTRELDRITAELAVVLEGATADRWTRRARPSFLYVMYALLLWSIPMGLIAAIHPAAAAAIGRGTTAYLAAIPEPLYALFGTGYLGYTVAREWGKGRGR